MRRHHLLEPAPPGRMVQAVSDICGAHAQVAASAELMIGLRVRGITRQDVRRALWQDRSLVKTPGVRGTLHLYPAEDVPYWMAANRLRSSGDQRRLERAGIPADEFDSVVRAIGEIVGPKPITRVELEAALEERVGGWAIQTNQGWMGTYRNWPMALGWAASAGLVCYGPGDGGRSTFVRLADWAQWREIDPEEGGKFALRRFLGAYGPSTAAEFSRWFNMAPALAKRLIEAVSDDLVEVAVEGEKRWALASDVVVEAEGTADAVHLLPHFDVFVVGSFPREQLIVPGTPVAGAAPGTASPFAVVLRGGRVAGVWERRPKSKRLLVRVDAYWPLKRKDRNAIEAQANRVAAILERDCELEFRHVELRPHA